MVRKKWMIVLMLSLYVSQWFSTANSTCIGRLLQSGCDSSDAVDVVSCCNAISNEIRNDQVCMCNLFNANVTVWTDALVMCKIDFDFVTECSARTTTTTPSTTTPSSTSSAGSTSSNTSTTNVLVGSVITTVGVTMIIVISIYCICKGQRHRNTANYPHAYAEMPKAQTTVLQQNNPSVYGGIPPTAPFSTPMTNVPPAPSGDVDFGADKSMQFDLSTLQAATNNFSEDNLMGRGGFGCVYKGTLSNGSEIAVKRLFKITSQVDQEIKAEIELLAKLQHRNLVRLLGFCLKKPEAILVYELLPNKSLDYFLFDNKKREELNWSIRFEIIRGVAKGLMYLHEDSLVKTIHRDLKPHNILLDANMNAKIADFGLARICAPDQTHVQATHVAGTDDYISPEYRYHRQISEKSDVYAFGIILLEIISGRRINCGFENQPGEPSDSLMSYAWRCWADEKPLTLVDPLMSRDSFSSDEVIKCIHLGLLCNQDDPRKRPNMSTIVHKLNSNPDIATLSTPQIPVFLFNSTSDQSTTTLTMQRSLDLSSCPASSSVDSNSKLSH